ncbi:MAG: hypothetical protein AB1798_12385 [Spirochaetota bacterium]
MKKRIILSLILFLFLAVVLMAEESTMFVKTLPITKVYLMKKGYRVVYIKSDMNLGVIHVPMAWFQNAGGKAEAVWGTDTSYPYFSIFYKEGKFDHIRLYLHRDRKHSSWGMMNPTPETDKGFETDTLGLEF